MHLIESEFYATTSNEKLEEIAKKFFVEKETGNQLSKQQLKLAIKSIKKGNPHFEKELPDELPSGFLIRVPKVEGLDFNPDFVCFEFEIPPLPVQEEEKPKEWWVEKKKKKIEGAKESAGYNEESGDFTYDGRGLDLTGTGITPPIGKSVGRCWFYYEERLGPIEEGSVKKNGYFIYITATGMIRKKEWEAGLGDKSVKLKSSVLEEFIMKIVERIEIQKKRLSETWLVVRWEVDGRVIKKESVVESFRWVDAGVDYEEGKLKKHVRYWLSSLGYTTLRDKADKYAKVKKNKTVRRVDEVPGAPPQPEAYDPFGSF